MLRETDVIDLFSPQLGALELLLPLLKEKALRIRHLAAKALALRLNA